MKLNNNGWGLGVFLGFVCLIVFCILFSSIEAYKAGFTKNPPSYFDGTISNNSSNSNTSKYNSYENSVLNASMNYKRDKYNNISSGQTVVVKLSTLVSEGYLSSTNDCNGYVIIKNQSDDIRYEVYLKCTDYISDGFNDSYISS